MGGIEEVLPTYEYAVDFLNDCANDLLPDDVKVKVSDDAGWLTFLTKDKTTMRYSFSIHDLIIHQPR